MNICVVENIYIKNCIKPLDISLVSVYNYEVKYIKKGVDMMTKAINVLALHEHEKTNILNTLNLQIADILCAHKVTMPIPAE